MRLDLAVFLAAALISGARISHAQEAAPPDPSQEAAPADRSQGTAPSEQSPCVDVEIGGDRSAYFECLNKQMQRGVEREHEIPQPAAPIDTHSPSNQVGTANDAAAREKMGNAFGKSAQPQRPKSTFENPLIPGSH